MNLEEKKVVVTGGSRGLGLGLVEALVAHSARVTVVARDTNALASVRTRLGVATISADVTDESAAHRILKEIDPDILVLNAGAKPHMGRLDQLSWEDFSVTWETDVRGGLYWLQAALKIPLRSGSRVLVGSSGAAQNGSPLSGGYAGAKRMLWLMAKYAIGDAGANAYARAMGVARDQFLARFGKPMPPREFGEKVVSVLEEAKYADGVVFGLKGDAGITVIEGAAA